MTNKKLRDFMIVLFVGLFLLTFEPVFMWLMIGGMVLFRSEKKTDKQTNDSEAITEKIARDAKEHGLHMPRTPQVRSLMIQVYRKLEKSTVRYPHLKDDYRAIVDEMWPTLSENQDRDYWVEVISSVLASWPDSKKSGIQSVKDQISRVSELTEQWEEAQNEVRGGAHV